MKRYECKKRSTRTTEAQLSKIFKNTTNTGHLTPATVINGYLNQILGGKINPQKMEILSKTPKVM